MVDEWRDLGIVVDRLLFVVSLIILSVVAIWMLVKSVESPTSR